MTMSRNPDAAVAANEMSKVVSFTVVGDAKVEANETFKVSLSGATDGAAISDNLGVATYRQRRPRPRDFGGDGRSDVLWRTTMARLRYGR